MHHFDNLESTNQFAADLIPSNPPEGTVINTFNQTKGRGQMGNIWLSSPNKNISTSIILYPKFLNINKQFYLSMIVSLALTDVVQTLLDVETSIKWPNDIYIGKNKIAGILIQNTLSAEMLSATIIGIGMNINQTSFESLKNVTSFVLEKNKNFDLELVLELILQKIEFYYLKLRNGNYTAIKKSYLEKLLFYNQWHSFADRNEFEFLGKIVDVQLDGKLMVNNGLEILNFDIKEIIFL